MRRYLRMKGNVMKRIIILFWMLICIFGLFGCSQNKAEPYIVNTFEETPAELIEEYIENAKVVTTTAHYEMSDGTWLADSHIYRYRLVITGRMNCAARDSTYIILSNSDDITFEQAWKASGLSSYLNDYFKVEDAVIVGIG